MAAAGLVSKVTLFLRCAALLHHHHEAPSTTSTTFTTFADTVVLSKVRAGGK